MVSAGVTVLIEHRVDDFRLKTRTDAAAVSPACIELRQMMGVKRYGC